MKRSAAEIEGVGAGSSASAPSSAAIAKDAKEDDIDDEAATSSFGPLLVAPKHRKLVRRWGSFLDVDDVDAFKVTCTTMYMLMEEEDDDEGGGSSSGSGAGGSGAGGPDFGDRLLRTMFGENAEKMGIGACILGVYSIFCGPQISPLAQTSSTCSKCWTTGTRILSRSPPSSSKRLPSRRFHSKCSMFSLLSRCEHVASS